MSDPNNLQPNFEVSELITVPEYRTTMFLTDVIERAIDRNEAELRGELDSDECDDWDRMEEAAEALNEELRYRGFIERDASGNDRYPTRAYIRHGSDETGILEDYMVIQGFAPYSQSALFHEGVPIQDEKAQIGLHAFRRIRDVFSSSHSEEIEDIIIPLNDPCFAVELPEDRVESTAKELIKEVPELQSQGSLAIAFFALTELLKDKEYAKRIPEIDKLVTKIANHKAFVDDPVRLSGLGVLTGLGFEPGGYKLEQRSFTTRRSRIEDLNNPYINESVLGIKALYRAWLNTVALLPEQGKNRGLIIPNFVTTFAHPSDTAHESQFMLATLRDNISLERISD